MNRIDWQTELVVILAGEVFCQACGRYVEKRLTWHVARDTPLFVNEGDAEASSSPLPAPKDMVICCGAGGKESEGVANWNACIKRRRLVGETLCLYEP